MCDANNVQLVKMMYRLSFRWTLFHNEIDNLRINANILSSPTCEYNIAKIALGEPTLMSLWCLRAKNLMIT